MLAALDGYRNDDGGYGWGLEWRGYATVNAIRHLLQSQPGFLGGAR